MKRILFVLFLFSFIIIGCDNTMNTPVNRVNLLFRQYQTLNKEVLIDLDISIKNDKNLNKYEKEEYKKLFIKQYQNLSYKIKKEDIRNNLAFVEVEIEVLDYKSALSKATQKYMENDKSCKSLTKCKIKELKKVNDKKKYDLLLTVEKKDSLWNIVELTNEDIKKIHGIV